MKKTSKILILFLIINILFSVKVLAVDINDIKLKDYEYTEAYKKYLEMSDEEKQNVVEPSKYDLGNNLSTNKAVMANEHISLKNLMSYLKSSAYSNEQKYTLMDYIPNNLKIKNQEQTNICWAFASLGSLETNLAMKDKANNITSKVYDYSERHMAYSKSSSFLDGQKNKYGWSSLVSKGANYYAALSYLTEGIGAINEQDMPFENNENQIDISQIQNKTVQTTLNDAIIFDVIEKTSQANETELQNLQKQIKEHISENGSVAASIYMPDYFADNEDFKFDTAAIYVSNAANKIQNHGVSIIGWDDTFSKDKFATTPKGDGAWIIRNSYGTLEEITYDEIKQMVVDQSKESITSKEQVTEQMLQAAIQTIKNQYPNMVDDSQNKKLTIKAGDNGIFYISYYDELVYGSLFGVINAESSKTYDKIYQYDEVGGTGVVTAPNSLLDELYLANVFSRDSSSTEYLSSVGIQTAKDGLSYEVYVNPSDGDKSLDKLQKVELVEGDNITLTSGYHTLKFKNKMQLTGSNFVVAIKVTAKSGEDISFWVENNMKNEAGEITEKNVTSNPGESFMGGIALGSLMWVDIGDTSGSLYRGNLTIKAMVENNSNPSGSGEQPSGGEQTPTGGTTPTEEVKGSDFTNSKAKLSGAEFDVFEQKFCITIKISGIKVDDVCDSYKHYFALSSKSTKAADEIIYEAGPFEKQSDGTYTLTIKVTSEEQLEDIDDSGVINVFVKEVATKGGKSVTTLSGPMELIVDLDENTGNGGVSVVSGNEDNTRSPNILPDTGVKIIAVSILIVAVFGIILFVKYRKLNDIK